MPCDLNESSKPEAREDIRRANRKAFDEAALVHAKYHLKKLLDAFSSGAPLRMDGLPGAILLEQGITGKSVAHLCCNNGRELLAVKRLGAERCVGFDISNEFIRQAQDLAKAGSIECEFERSDVYEIPTRYDAGFDVVLVTPGSLCCLPDLRGFFGVASRLLRPYGLLLMHEMHPMIDVYYRAPSRRPIWPVRSYFQCGPTAMTGGLDYYKRRRYKAKPFYFVHHKMSDIIQACIDSGLMLETFEENAKDMTGGVFRHFERRIQRIPLSYILTARRRNGKGA